MGAGSYFTVHQASDETPPAPAPRILVGPKAAVPTNASQSLAGLSATYMPLQGTGTFCSLYQTRIQKSLWVFLRLHF